MFQIENNKLNYKKLNSTCETIHTTKAWKKTLAILTTKLCKYMKEEEGEGLFKKQIKRMPYSWSRILHHKDTDSL